ncbi:MAG: ATPase [Deltaproteobacteria bacterium HGW-Deltaproteobacteria-6]|jgi:V/A-type H+-transporting ATPase subunit K|nr:MAG: ATPase [Deltaproteobacteria bacterium HGW-Deltaproteobacteria-6]
MIRDKLLTFLTWGIFSCAGLCLFPALLWAAEGSPGKASTDAIGLAYIGAGVAVGFACLASGYAVAKIGSAAIGAVSEKPELMGRTLVFLGLAEGIAIYGLIIAIMILNKL